MSRQERTTNRIRIKRAYDPPSSEDGTRFLVDRLWPRGVTKEKLGVKAWLRDAAPSDGLRKTFCHDPNRWPDFVSSYAEELENKLDSIQPIVDALRIGDVTLIYAAKDTQYNNAAALASLLASKTGARFDSPPHK